KKEEQELKESEMKYRTLVEQSPEGILLGQGPLPHIVYANPAMKNISGYSVQELSSFTFQQTVGLVHPDDRELFFERFKDRLEGKPTPERYMFRGIKKDGTIIWVDLSSALIEYKGQPTVQAIFRDITDQVNTEERIKQSEEKFKESEEKYHRLAIYAPVAIYEIDCKSLRFKCVNEYMSKISGYSEKELLFMSPLELLDAESKGIFQNIMRKSIAGEKIDENIEFGVITKDGRHLWSTLSAKLTYKNNELDSAFVVAYNFNKEKKGRL
ncbi:MAG: PAS domain-containing protein, partial [Candidatus Bathyarchaeia archaeon]